MTRSMGPGEHTHSSRAEGGESLNPDQITTQLETASYRMVPNSDGTTTALDESGVVDEGSDAADVLKTVLSNITSYESVGMYPGTYSWNQKVTHSINNVDYVTPPGPSVRLKADSAISEFFEITNPGGRVTDPPHFHGLKVDGNNNAARFVRIDSARRGSLKNIFAEGLTDEFLVSEANEDAINSDRWKASEITLVAVPFGRLQAGSAANSSDWKIEHVQIPGLPAGEWGLEIYDSGDVKVEDFFAGNNSDDVAGTIKVDAPNAAAGAAPDVQGVVLEYIGLENASGTSTAAAVEIDASSNNTKECVVRDVAANPNGDCTAVRLRSSGGIRQNRGCTIEHSRAVPAHAAYYDIGTDVYQASIVDKGEPNRLDQYVTNNGDFSEINGLGVEAAGSSNPPTADQWTVGQFVENTSDGTLWLKKFDGTMAQVA